MSETTQFMKVMNKIPPTILNFITQQRSCVLAVETEGSTVHAAAMLYSERQSPLEFFFFTLSTSKKTEKVTHGVCSASVVIGTTEEIKQTTQLDGKIELVTNTEELDEIKKIHYQKHPLSKSYEDTATVFLKFTPTWWKHTDYTTRPPTVLE